jgi:hypothetical protein
MQINEHYGILRPLDYNNLIAGDWELWANNQMGVLNRPMFRVLDSRLEAHAERCIEQVFRSTSTKLEAVLVEAEGMVRVHFKDCDGNNVLLKDYLKRTDGPKFNAITVRRFLEILFRDSDETLIYTEDFRAFTEMMLEDLEEESIESLIAALPWLVLSNERFAPYI